MPKLVPECLSLLYLGNIPLRLSDPALLSFKRAFLMKKCLLPSLAYDDQLNHLFPTHRRCVRLQPSTAWLVPLPTSLYLDTIL